jgi:hypothetical protein
VYTVYIYMGDSGGGPDWAMQYALLDSTLGGSGLLSPPVAQKKVPAIIPKEAGNTVARRIQITGTIDENGSLQKLRSLRPADIGSQVAISALEQWQFLPAQIEGKPVATKVLIGVILGSM